MLCCQAFLDIGPALHGHGGSPGPCPAEQFLGTSKGPWWSLGKGCCRGRWGVRWPRGQGISVDNLLVGCKREIVWSLPFPSETSSRTFPILNCSTLKRDTSRFVFFLGFPHPRVGVSENVYILCNITFLRRLSAGFSLCKTDKWAGLIPVYSLFFLLMAVQSMPPGKPPVLAGKPLSLEEAFLSSCPVTSVGASAHRGSSKDGGGGCIQSCNFVWRSKGSLLAPWPDY